MEHWNTDGIVTKREIVKITNRVGDIFTITRAFESCVQDDTAEPKTVSQVPLNFDAGDFLEMRLTEEIMQEIKDEIGNTDNTSNLVHKTGIETISGAKTFT